MDSLTFFNTIFENNKNTICIPNEKIGIHDINFESVNKYIASNCIEKLHPLLNFIFKNIKYIDFNTFYSSLREYIININKVHRDGDNDMVIKVHLIIPDFSASFAKSNFWISLLIKKIIIDYDIKNFEIVNIVDSIEYFTRRTLDKNHIGIFPDDCAYSGQQSGDHLFQQRLILNNKIYVMIPYISNYAYAMYKTKAYEIYMGMYPENIVFLENCIYFVESLPELCVNNGFNIFENDVYYLDNQNYENMERGEEYEVKSFIKDILLLPECGALIYFDHKIADQASTIQYFLNYSTILSDVYVAENIDIDSDIYFKQYSKNYSTFVNRYFMKPINIFSSEFKSINLSSLRSHIRNFYGKGYAHGYFSKLQGHSNFIKKLCDTDIVYYSVINNCNNRSFYKLPDSDVITLFDLNKLKDERGNDYSCPNTFYKKPGFYTYNINSINTQIGGYYNKYLSAKKKYLELKK